MAVYNIANRAELVAALKSATGGETFVLAAGNYGDIDISNRNFAATVTIQSQSATSLATFSHFDINSSSNIAVKGIDVGRAMTPVEQDFGKMVSLYDARNISLDQIRFHGTLNNNPRDDGWGIVVSDSSNVSVTNSDFTELNRGAVFQRTEQLVVQGNNFHNIRSDGADFTAVDTVLVKDNQFRDFYFVPGDHPDAIQFWTQGQTRASANITITGNQVFQGKGLALQGIHIRDEVGNMPFKNVKIDNNLLYANDLWHGIHVDHGQGISITNNTVVSRTTDDPFFWIKVENVAGVTIQKNVTDMVIADDRVSGANISGNIELRFNAAGIAMLPNLNHGASTTVADLLVNGYGYHPDAGAPTPTPNPTPIPTPSPAPTPTPTPSPAASLPKTIYGAAGGDTVKGTTASETIYGVPATGNQIGRDSADRLIGGGGADVFVLGDQRGAFYMDNTNMWSGRKDYAQILDFGSDDRIRLAGVQSDYVFRRETINGQVGTSIFRDTNRDHRWDNSDELIGHVAKVHNLSMSALIFAGGNSGTSQSEAPAPIVPPVQMQHPVPIDPTPPPLEIQVSNLPVSPVFGPHMSFAHLMHFALA
jgi:hypothetical protein